MNEKVLSLETAEPEVEEPGVNSTGWDKFELATAILKFDAVVADPTVRVLGFT